MSMINPEFEKFIRLVENKGDINEIILKAEKMYNLKPFNIFEITSSQAIKLYESIYLKFYKCHQSQLASNNWYENQLRIFIWTLVCYCDFHQRHVMELGPEDWTFFSTVFDKKDPKLFEYQCHALCSNFKGKPWESEEQSILINIMAHKVRKAKWNQISKQLFHNSNRKYFRTAKQCRERWNNHLDPNKIKGFWKAQECLIMFQYVRQHGKKWASLVKILKGTRNEHSIKNKFNSILKKHQKLHPSEKEETLYDQIIGRIQKSIENKSVFHRDDASFEFESFESPEVPELKKQKQRQKDKQKEKIEEKITYEPLNEPKCHKITQNFLKILQTLDKNTPKDQVKIEEQALEQKSSNLKKQQKYLVKQQPLPSLLSYPPIFNIPPQMHFPTQSDLLALGFPINPHYTRNMSQSNKIINTNQPGALQRHNNMKFFEKSPLLSPSFYSSLQLYKQILSRNVGFNQNPGMGKAQKKAPNNN